MIDKMPTGVEMNGKQLRIWFIFNGQRCREPLEGISKVNKAAIAYADNKRRTILAEIKEGRFDYAAHFPNSPRAAMFTGTGGPSLKRTVKEGIDRWLEVQRALKASSTVVNYVSKSVHVNISLANAGSSTLAKATSNCSRCNCLSKAWPQKR